MTVIKFFFLVQASLIHEVKNIRLITKLQWYLVDTDKVGVVELPHDCDLHQHQLLAGLLAQVHLPIT